MYRITISNGEEHFDIYAYDREDLEAILNYIDDSEEFEFRHGLI
jgi:hypothetical protein